MLVTVDVCTSWASAMLCDVSQQYKLNDEVLIWIIVSAAFSLCEFGVYTWVNVVHPLQTAACTDAVLPHSRSSWDELSDTVCLSISILWLDGNGAVYICVCVCFYCFCRYSVSSFSTTNGPKFPKFNQHFGLQFSQFSWAPCFPFSLANQRGLYAF